MPTPIITIKSSDDKPFDPSGRMDSHDMIVTRKETWINWTFEPIGATFSFLFYYIFIIYSSLRVETRAKTLGNQRVERDTE